MNRRWVLVLGLTQIVRMPELPFRSRTRLTLPFCIFLVTVMVAEVTVVVVARRLIFGSTYFVQDFLCEFRGELQDFLLWKVDAFGNVSNAPTEVLVNRKASLLEIVLQEEIRNRIPMCIVHGFSFLE